MKFLDDKGYEDDGVGQRASDRRRQQPRIPGNAERIADYGPNPVVETEAADTRA